MKRVNVGGFILLHAQNVANGLELQRDDRPQQRAGASETLDSVIKASDVQDDPIS